MLQPYGVAAVRQRSTVTSVTRQPGGAVQLDITGETAHFVAIQYSDDLLTWQTLAGVPTPTGSASYLAVGPSARHVVFIGLLSIDRSRRNGPRELALYFFGVCRTI